MTLQSLECVVRGQTVELHDPRCVSPQYGSIILVFVLSDASALRIVFASYGLGVTYQHRISSIIKNWIKFQYIRVGKSITYKSFL